MIYIIHFLLTEREFCKEKYWTEVSWSFFSHRAMYLLPAEDLSASGLELPDRNSEVIPRAAVNSLWSLLGELSLVAGGFAKSKETV